MATAVFTNAEIDFFQAIGGGGAWTAAAAGWPTAIEGDSGVTLNAGAVSPLLQVAGTLHDDASIPADIVISSIAVSLDWSVTNAGGAGGVLTQVNNRASSLGHTAEPTQNVGTSSGTFTNTYSATGYTGLSNPTRADLFAAFFGFSFAIIDLTTTSSRVVISNYTVTVTYHNVGVGSWMVRCAQMTNPTGATDFVSFFPDAAVVQGAGAVGGIDLPVKDTAGAFIYVDGSVTPVAVAGLPTGFVPADAYEFNHSTFIEVLTAQDRYVHPTLFDFTVTGATLPSLGATQGLGGAEELTGMDLTVLGGLIGDTITATMTDQSSPDGVFTQNFTTFDLYGSAYFVGTYALATFTSLTPNEGTVLGGTTVTLIGTNLQAVTAVKFDGVSATAVVANANGLTVTCVTPAHVAGAVNVEAVGVGTLVAAYTYINIISIKPNKGTVNGGTLVTIKGGGFSVATAVLFDGIDAPIQSQSNTVITVLTPAHAVGLVDVEVVGVATETDAYTYVSAIGPITVPPMPVLSPATQKGQP